MTAQTPYDGTVGIVHWAGKAVSERTIDEIVATLVHEAPNVNAVYVKTSDGAQWQGMYDDPENKHDLCILGPDDIVRWVRKLRAANIDFHAWAVLKGVDVAVEAQRVAAVCNVAGVQSMLLDVESGAGYFSGGPTEARALITRIRADIPTNFHIGLNFDARGLHPQSIYINEWLPHVQSLHPMVYHREFGLSPEEAIARAFESAGRYGRPIIPMLQAYHGVPGSEMVSAAEAAFAHGAPGVSYFRYGTITHAGFEALQSIIPPGAADDGLDQPGEIVGQYTNQQVINAFARAAAAMGQGAQYWAWIEAAQLTHIASARSAVYAGVMIRDLPNLTLAQKRQVVSELRAMTPITAHRKLDVPWVSQLDNRLPNDCGHASVLMLLKYAGLGDGLTVNDLFYSGVAPQGYTTAWHLVRLAAHYGLSCAVESPFAASDYFIAQINDNKPVIPLVDYASLNLPPHLISGPDQGAHWLVVVGYDRDYYYVHDPLWLPAQVGGVYREGGRWHPIPKATMEAAIRAVRSRTCVYPK
ncbi:MAG: hypothetical protein Kow00120_20990 [Anaerolineae bacterium]